MGKEPAHTGVNTAKLASIANSTVYLPEYFKVNPRPKKIFMDPGMRIIDSGKSEWDTAEACAFGSLATEGYNVRLIGEGSKRGTFLKDMVSLRIKRRLKLSDLLSSHPTCYKIWQDVRKSTTHI